MANLSKLMTETVVKQGLLIALVPQLAYSFHSQQQLDLERGTFYPGKIEYVWGIENLVISADPGMNNKYMRVRIPTGSLDPETMRRENKPYGGLGFKARIYQQPKECATLAYKIRFPSNFEFVRGGKLPGLYGGVGNSGGVIPNGLDGFSVRLMWLDRGYGQVYAYLPDSKLYGTAIGARKFQFQRGEWESIKLEVSVNSPGNNDGHIKVWLNDRLVIDQQGLRFRDTHHLGINGIFFDVFFGGNDDSWRSRQDTFIDFSGFVISECDV